MRIQTTGGNIYEKTVVAMGGGKMAVELNILGHARLLLREATMAFDAGASSATVLACRASLEAACLGFLCRQWNKKGYWGLDLPRTFDGKIRIVSFEELIAGVEKTRALTVRNLIALRRVQREGNLIAHYVSGRERGFARLMHPEEHGVHVGEKVKLWLGRDDAMRDLEDTASIIATLGAQMFTECSP